MDLHNTLNLLSLNCNGFKNKANIILDTYPNIDLFCFQEHWLSSEESSIFNTNNNSYSGYGNASFDNTKLRTGRPFGGVGFMWKKGIDRYISIMQSEYDWLICIKVFDFYIINIYIYRMRILIILVYLKVISFNCYYIVNS